MKRKKRKRGRFWYSIRKNFCELNQILQSVVERIQRLVRSI